MTENRIIDETFYKIEIKRAILKELKYHFRKTLETASDQEIFQAVAYAAKNTIIDNWLRTHKAYADQNAKKVFYLSMEFLMGRALGNNLINLCCYKEVADVLKEIGVDINQIEDQ